MLSPRLVFPWVLGVGCLAVTTANAQQGNVRWNNAQRPNVPRGFQRNMQPGPLFAAPANNFGRVPGAGFFNTPFGPVAFPAGLNGGRMGGGMMGGGMMNGMGGFGINNGLGGPPGGMYRNGPFGNPFNNPLANPFNHSFNGPLASPFLSPFNSPLNGGYVGNGFNGPMMVNPAFSNPFNVRPPW